MTITILAGGSAAVSVTVLRDGFPVPVSGDVRAAVFTADARRRLVEPFELSPDAPGAEWLSGVVGLELTADQVATIPIGEAMLVITGAMGLKRFRLVVETMELGTRNSLFIKDIVVDEIRRDRLTAAAAGVLQDVQVSDEYLWTKVRVAEADLARTLKVPLVPTKFFPAAPSEQAIADLDGMAWAVDPGYDYDPTLFERDKWGFLVTRHRPIISIDSMRFAYPSADAAYFDIPKEWLRIDARAGHVRLVPSTNAMIGSLSGFGFTVLMAGNVVPSMVQLTYIAGLKDAVNDYPELLDVIKKMAVLKVVGDAFLPQSGSISADGLSQSLSVDMSSYAASIDEAINGPKGSNGGLMTAIHGIRLAVA